MRCDIQLLDEQENPWFVCERELPGEYILKLAAERLPMLKEKGAEFAQGAVPVFGEALAKIVKARAGEDEIEKAVIQLALATVTVEMFFGVDEGPLLNRNFHLAVYESGAVRIDNLED